MKLYVGNLPFSASSESLRTLFSQHGEVTSAEIVMDRDTGRSRGFGFVEMDDAAGRTAIERLDGSDMDGRRLTVNEARPKTARSGGGGGGYNRGNDRW
jgi:RNA recognition motif-containing protein